MTELTRTLAIAAAAIVGLAALGSSNRPARARRRRLEQLRGAAPPRPRLWRAVKRWAIGDPFRRAYELEDRGR